MFKSGLGLHARNFFKVLCNCGYKVNVIDDRDGEISLSNVKFVKRNNKRNAIVHFTGNLLSHFPEKQFTIFKLMFESDRIPPLWVEKLKTADLVLVPSKFNYRTFIKSGVKKDKIFVLKEPVSPSININEKFKFKTKKSFKFLSVFSEKTLYRKGADILLKTYLKSFSYKDDVCLIIKSNISKSKLFKELSICKSSISPEIEIINEFLEENEMEMLFKSVHSFVLPSRGEGIGLPYMQAMLEGIPVIATGWSGNTEFMNSKNAFLVNYKLIKVSHDLSKVIYPWYFGGMMAEPCVFDLQAKLKYVYNNYNEAKVIGERGRKFLLKYHSFEAVSNYFKKVIKNFKPIKEKYKLNEFFKLYPIYFPKGETKFNTLEKKIRKETLRSVCIYGTGNGAKNAFNWFSKFNNITNITFCDKYKDVNFFQGKEVIFYKDLSKFEFDIIVIASLQEYIKPIFERIKPFVKVPVYYYF